MRLRRLEFVIIGVTLAFACFMGGFFTGRSWSAVNIVSVATQSEEAQGAGGISVKLPEVTFQEENASFPVDINPVNPANPPPLPTDNQQEHTEDSESAIPPEMTGAPRGGDGKININLASQSELTDLPGIGSVLASRIIDYRQQHGGFSRIEDIRNVSGIGEKRYEAIQDKITVG